MDRRRFISDSTKMGVASSLPGVGAPLAAPAELPSEIVDFTASQLSAAIRLRQVGCVEVMQAYLRHIHRYNPTYKAIVSMAPDDQLIAQARRADEAWAGGDHWGWMHGMPHAVKDLADVMGFPTSQGSPIYAGTMPDADSRHIARIRAQGAIFIGKTNVPEFGMGSQSYNPVFGATGSACDPSLTAGGSSGGAASGLGTHMLPVADGSDLMGSLRNPGAFNHVIGFRPTPGRVPGSGAGDLFHQELSVNGPMGRNTEDTVRLLHTIAGHSRADAPALDAPRLHAALRRSRYAVAPQAGGDLRDRRRARRPGLSVPQGIALAGDRRRRTDGHLSPLDGGGDRRHAGGGFPWSTCRSDSTRGAARWGCSSWAPSGRIGRCWSSRWPTSGSRTTWSDARSWWRGRSWRPVGPGTEVARSASSSLPAPTGR